MKLGFLKRLLMSILAVVFPWVVLLIEDNPGGALLAFLLQATILGWIPASMWAWRVVHEPTVTKRSTSSSVEKS